MKVAAVIPVRMAASRFPGKPLAKILGMPMVGHIYHRSKMANKVDDLYIATCDQEIMDYAQSIGAKAVMTKDTWERATERVGEAIEGMEGEKPDIVIMVQGDEPMIHPDTLDKMVEVFEANPDVQVVNLTNTITDDSEYGNKDIVKLVADKNGQILWFFRRPDSLWADKVKDLPIKIQTGIIAFRTPALFAFNKLEPTMFEKVNSVDMFRFLEHGHNIQISESDKRLYSVDTPEDLALVEEKLQTDDIMNEYIKK